jgi:lipopolysaccharide/colanic/teichoic acid biosynthesis glycosyltransferase
VRTLSKFLDVALSFAALLLLSPVLAFTALAILAKMGTPILFRQTRVGRHERLFVFYKFRTMTDGRDPSGKLLPDGQRLTWLGEWLRRLSLDELPQLWNVLKGDMGVVGPRPLLPEYLPRYSGRQRRRHEVLPGITGWAQVNGRNALSWEQKFELDVWYVDHWSLRLDIKIVWLTLLKVIRRDGISQHGHATMPEFMGATSFEPRTK